MKMLRVEVCLSHLRNDLYSAISQQTKAEEYNGNASPRNEIEYPNFVDMIAEVAQSRLILSSRRIFWPRSMTMSQPIA